MREQRLDVRAGGIGEVTGYFKLSTVGVRVMWGGGTQGAE